MMPRKGVSLLNFLVFKQALNWDLPSNSHSRGNFFFLGFAECLRVPKHPQSIPQVSNVPGGRQNAGSLKGLIKPCVTWHGGKFFIMPSALVKGGRTKCLRKHR